MGIRRRLAYVYPGTHRVGIAGVVMDGNRVHKIAVGSTDRAVAPAWLTSFKPDEMAIAPDKIHDRKNDTVFIPDTVLKMRFIHPGWHNRKVPWVDRVNPHKGLYVHNVWKMFFDDCVRRSDMVLTHLDVEEFNIEWVEKNRPQGVRTHD